MMFMEADKIFDVARRRGFFFPASEIYGGFSGFYDYGTTGTLLKRKIESEWKRFFLGLSPNFFEIETSNIMPEKVFKASGHLESFVDPVAKCRKCGTFHRADHIMEEFLHESFEGITVEELTKLIKKHKIKCPKCGGELGEVKVLNMMFPLSLGAGEDTKGYLRPETAQGAYVSFLRQFNILRNQLPIGLAIVGKAFRNEIAPRQLLIRQREFTQAELQIFFDQKKVDEHENWDEVKDYELQIMPIGAKEKEFAKMTCEEAHKKLKLPKFYLYYAAKVQQFFLDVLQIDRKKFRLKELSEEERAFYNKIHYDCQINLDSLGGFKEIGGIHYRTDHDLSGHQKVSNEKHEIFFDGRRFIPHVLELSFGVDRIFYSLLELFYREDKKRGWDWFAFPPRLAPFQLAVFPLVSKDNLPEKAGEIYRNGKMKLDAIFDEGGTIGKRYARSDEIGTPYAMTIDYDTLKDNTVTVRSRDTTEQIRIKIADWKSIVEMLINGEAEFKDLGKLV